MQVVAAGVHRAVRGRPVQPGRLRDRQPVHVAAQQHGPGFAGTLTPTAQHGDDACHLFAEADLEGQALELSQQPCLGGGQVQPHLGRLVQLVPEGDEVWLKVEEKSARVHSASLAKSARWAGDVRPPAK